MCFGLLLTYSERNCGFESHLMRGVSGGIGNARHLDPHDTTFFSKHTSKRPCIGILLRYTTDNPGVGSSSLSSRVRD